MKTKRLIVSLTVFVAALACGIACTDELSSIENLDSQTKLIPFTVSALNVDDSKATIDYKRRILFESDDKLVITGEGISGTLFLKTGGGKTSAEFSGTLEYVGAGEPSPDLVLNATLISKDDAGGSLEGFTGGIAADLVEAVQKYSALTGTSTYGEKKFSLSQKNTFVDFEVELSPAPADGQYAAVVTNNNGSDELASGDVAIDGGVVTFTLAVPGNLELSQAKVSVAETYIRFGGSGKTLDAGTLYHVNKSFNDDLHTPLTFEAMMDQNIVVTIPAEMASTLTPFEYRVNGGARQTVNMTELTDVPIAGTTDTRSCYVTTIAVDDGDIVNFYGDNDCYAYDVQDMGPLRLISVNIVASAGAYVYGNVMSMINSSDFAAENAFQADFALAGLFNGYDTATGNRILNHASRKLLLPATTLTTGCYFGMFAKCVDLVEAPDLPAKAMTPACYCSMFDGCSSLTTVGDLAPDVMAPVCYAYMFYKCSSLQRAPSIRPESDMQEECCNCMFMGCSSLEFSPSLPDKALAKSCYSNMFDGCGNLLAAPALPSTDLADYCYNNMFKQCTSLSIAPALPATTLAYGCYAHMFDGCSYLSVAPELPATTLADHCYDNMFARCPYLEDAPALPATTLAKSCYCGMFIGTEISAAPALPATTLAENCYQNMFTDCDRLTAAPVLPATTLAKGCYSWMFSKCDHLSKAPVLPAKVLVENCYYEMFWKCSNLTYIKCLATDISAPLCTNGWVEGVPRIGTFVEANGMDDWTVDSVDGIPVGWRLVDEDYATPMTLEAFFRDAEITIKNPLNLDIYYTIDDGEMQHYDRSFYLLVGQVARFYGDNSAYARKVNPDDPDDDDWMWTSFTCSMPCYLYGNFMSLIDANNFVSKIKLTEPYCLAGLFNLEDGESEPENSFIFNHPEKDIYLPATTLTEGCYMTMFSNCPMIQRAPELPATRMTSDCYEAMFWNCLSLKTAPDLPSTQLADYCYADMFGQCENLETAPVLPATTLLHSSYSGMFYGCKKLNYVKCLALNNLADGTKEWLCDVAATGTFVKNPAAEWSHTGGDRGIPSGWTVIEDN